MTGWELRERLATPVAEIRDVRTDCLLALAPTGPISTPRSPTRSSPSWMPAGYLGCSPGGQKQQRHRFGIPKNAATGRRYSGINVPILWGVVIANGYPGQCTHCVSKDEP